MAKRNQVTTELRISADAQLKNSKSFVREIEKIAEGLDIGTKLYGQLNKATSQLKDYNKILEKVQSKSLMSDSELKDLTKVSKEITNIISKTEKLYNSFSADELRSFTKEYVKQVKEQEAAVAKIKNDYAAKTGKNFDKELANYDKLKSKIKELEREQANLSKNGVSNLTAKKIEEVNKKLEEQKTKLIEIKKIQEQSSISYSSTLDSESKKRGYKDYNEIKGMKVLSEDQIRKQLGTAAYREQSNLISTIGREIRELEKNKQDTNALDKEAVKIAKKYQIENVKGLNDLKEQFRIRKNILEINKKDKSKFADEKAVTATLKEQLQIAKDKKAIEDAGKAAQLKTIQTMSEGTINSKASLSASASAITKSIANLNGQLTENGIEAITNNATNIIAGRLDKLNNELTQAKGDLSSIDETNKKLATQSERSADETDIKEMRKGINNDVDSAQKNINNNTTKDNSKIATQIIEEFHRNKIEGYRDIINEGLDNLTKEDYNDDEVIEGNRKLVSTNVEKIFSQLDDFANQGNNFDELSANLKQMIHLTDEITDAYEEELAARIKRSEEEIESYNLQLKNANSPEAKAYLKSSIKGAEKNIEADKASLTPYIDTSVKMGNEFRHVLSKLEDNGQLKQYADDAFILSNNLNKAAEQSAFLGSTFDDIKNKVGYFLSLNYVFDQMTRKISEAVQTTKEMDKDMTQIGLVLGKTSGQVWKNFNTYSQMAERLNTTTSQVTNSMKLFYQQGLNTSEVNKMVEASAIAAALGESSLAEASETLTSILNSYNLSANEALSVTDKISQIAIVSAADFGELSTAIEKVASSAASAGLDLDHMMGYLAKMIETTREAPTNIGTALKTIVANFTQFKEDPSGLGEEGSEINKVDKALKSVGISLTDTNGEVRDLGDVLDELGGIWNNLNRNQRAYLATQIAGNRQQSRFYALMNDYERTLELVAEGSNSAGKAQQQFALYSNSLEAATNRLTNQWEKFFNDITKGNGLVATFTNSLTSLMKIANTIGPIGTVLGIGSFTKSAREAISVFNNLRTLIDTRKERDNVKQGLFNDIKNDNSLSKEQKKEAYNKVRSDYMKANLKDIEKLNSSEIKYLNTITKVEKQQEQLDISLRGSSKTIDKFQYSIGTLGNNSKKVWASMKLGASQVKKALISMSTQFAILAVASLAIKGIGAIFEGVRSALDLNTEAYIENAEKANENAENINGLKLEYEQLAKKVNRTAEEEERLKEITKEVTKIDSKLGQQLKENANNYEANIKAMQEYSDLQEKIAAQEAAKAVRSEASIGNNLFMLLNGDTWTNWFGSETDKQQLKSEQQTNWRELAGSRGIEQGLSSTQTAMLNRYVDDLIKWQDEQGWDGLTYKFNTGEFDETISSFINGLKKLNTVQEEQYTSFVTELNDGTSSYAEMLRQWSELDLPEEIKDNLSQQLADIMTSIRNQIDSNNYIQNKDKAYGNALKFLSVTDANKLFNPNTSSMTKDEIDIYKKDLAKFIEDTTLIENYSKAQAEGGEALKVFSKDLQKGGQYTQVFTDAIYSAGQALTSEQFEKAISNLLSLGELDIKSLMNGETSQLDILKELGKGTIDFKDLIVSENGTLSVSSSRLIAEQEKNFKIIFDTLYGVLDKRQAEMDNLAANDNPAMAKIISSRDQELQNAREKNRVNASYEGGYQKDWKAVEAGWWENKDVTSEFKNKSVEELQNFIQKNAHLENNDLATSYIQSQIKGARYSIAEQSMDSNIIKDPNKMNDREKNQYLKESLELYNQEIQKVAELDKNSQEYYNSTYKITKLQDTINETIDKGGILEEDRVKIANEYNEKIDTQRELNKGVGAEISKQIAKDKERLTLVEKQVKTNLNYQKGFAGFFDGLDMSNTLLGQLEGIKTAYQQINEEIVDMDQLQQTLASNPALMQALDVTAEGLTWNKQKLEELGIAAIDESYNYIEARINDMEATKATLATQSEDISQWSEQAVTQTAAVIGGNNSLIDSQQENAQNEATNLGISEQSWITWSDTVCKAIEAAGNQYNEFLNSEANKAKGNYKSGYNASAKVGSGGGGKGSASVESKKQDIAETLKATGYSANKTGAIENINKQIEVLRGLQNTMKHRKTNIGDYLGGDLYSSDSGGSKDKFEPVIEKLEKFYNYLRQIEEIEAKLNRLREKRNLIDASKNYYIDDLEKENSLLREQQAIYNNYIRDQGSYLAELQSQIQAQFGDWAYFNEDGVVQVKQTEFTANSEAEEERLNTFLELIDLYQNEYNTREENINKLYEIESTQLENIQTMYDKILSRVTDITDELNRQKDLLDHDMTMSFSNIAKFDIMDDQMGVAVGGISNAQAYLNDFEKQVSDLNKEVKNGPFSELLLWDETLNQWRTNEEALQDPSIIAKYEKMGYTWQDIDTYIRSVAVKSQSINEAIKETTDSVNEFAEVLKQLIDDRISIIQDFFGAATDELNKIFDTFNSKMEDIDNQNDLFGVSASALEEKYLTAVTAVAVLKQTLQSLRDNKGTILETIQKDYPEYIEMINGVAVVNKQAIEESTKLTEAQKSDLLQLYGILEASEDQITEMEDKLIDYFNTMMEMEREKRDAIIELKQSLHDELIARDQQEIDDLRSKYDKMSQLDNEYYSELSRRVSDARNLRDDRQQSANIGQMQAQLAVLKADNSGTYNSELINLQKQLNEALQTQADNEVTRELERIQREQQEREEDRQLTISAMENVLTFKDENSWYWQEAQRIWNEGPESVTGFLRASNEYANISDEQRAVEFENLTNSMNTAFTTLQTESGLSDRISDGIVTEKSNEEQLKLDNVNSNLDFIQEQLGESGLAGKIDWSNSQTMSKLDSVIAGSNADALAITNKMQTLYTEKIGPGTEGVKNAITSYLGENSSIWKKLKETDDALDKTGLDMNSGFANTVDAATSAASTIVDCIDAAKQEYIDTDTRLFKWLDDKYAKDNAEKNGVDTGASTGATVKVPTTNGSGNSVSSTGGNGGGSNAASKPDLKIGSTISVKPGTRWYYDSYGTNPSGTARGGRITYTNLKGSHSYNIEGLGWIRKQDIVGYSKGGYVDYTGIANVHGTQTEPEAFLNAKQTRLFEGLRDSLVRSSSNRTYDKKESEIAKEEYNIDNISIEVKQIADIDAVDKITRRVKEEIYKDATSNKNNMAVRRR